MPFSGWEKECSKEQTSSLLIEEGHLQRDVVSTWEYRRYYVAQRGEKRGRETWQKPSYGDTELKD